MRQLRALEVFVPDVNPALAPVYIGQCTGMQEDFAPLSHNNCQEMGSTENQYC